MNCSITKTLMVMLLLFSPLAEAGSVSPLNEAKSLHKKSVELYKAGKYEEAIPPAKKALGIREDLLGRDHPDVALSLNNLALCYVKAGRYADAEPLHKRALEIHQKSFGPDHPNVAASLNNLALLYKATGRYAEAEPLYRRALEIREKSFGPDHRVVASSLNSLATLYSSTGRYSEAEVLFKRALHIWEKELGPDDRNVATSLNNLALLYKSTGRFTEAEDLLKRTLRIWEKALGPDHPDVATSLNNLAYLYKSLGRNDEAETLYLRSLGIRKKGLGPDHPAVAQSMNNLGGVYESAGRYAEAETLYRGSLVMWERALGPDHPDVGTGINKLARLCAVTERHGESHRLFVRGISIEDKKRMNVFMLLSESDKMDYMKSARNPIYAFLTHTVRDMAGDKKAAADALNAWIRWKGAVLEAQGRIMDAAFLSDDPGVQKKAGELNDARRQLGRLQMSGPGETPPAQYRRELEELASRKESLEADLSRLSKDFALEKKTVTADVKRLSEILPAGSVYIDFAGIDIYNLRKGRTEEPRYLAFILIPGKDPQVTLLDLTPAEDADRHIREYLEEMKKPAQSGSLPRKQFLTRWSQAIYTLILKPLEPYIKNRKQLFISPDGNLNLIPFEVLMTPEGRYLMEDHIINYVGAGRDIVRFTDTNKATGSGLIMADPDYDLGIKEKEEITGGLGVAKTVRGLVSRDTRGLRFKRLPDTKQEADSIEKILSGRYGFPVKNYQYTKALEEVLFSQKPPRVLHLATHGYFLQDEETKKVQDSSAAGDDNVFSTGREEPGVLSSGIENPMLRSGIVLAGVNAALREGRDDGVVTADKVLALKLRGTDLVVLSACETGVGDVKNGEGVFGLKRAFLLSGAKTLVMSLWSVPSAETTELMTDFYTLMADGRTKAEALRQAKLRMMKNNPNPYFWGAFVMTGKPD